MQVSNIQTELRIVNKWDLLQGRNAGLTVENPAAQNPLNVLTENFHDYVMGAN